jgi:predicted PurR-regulated permease PerM
MDPANLPRRERVIGTGLAWVATWSWRWIVIAAGAVLMGLVVRETWSIVLPVFLALLLSSVLASPARLLEERLKFPASLSAATVLLAGIGIVIGAGFAIAPSVAGQSDDIVADASRGLQKVQDWVQTRNFVTEAQVATAIEALQTRLTDSASSIASGVLVGVGAVTSAVVTLVITLVLTFFFLKDGRRFIPWVRGLAGPRVGPHLDKVMGEVWATLGSFIYTQALVSLIDAVFIGIALVVVGVPLALPLAILTFFGGFVPIVGAFVVGAIAVLVALVSVGGQGALIILVVIFAVQQIEGNVLSPWLQSKSMKLHAAVVLLAVTLGSTLFGIVGAFLAVPVVAVAAVVLRYLNRLVTATVTPAEADPPVAPAPAAARVIMQPAAKTPPDEAGTGRS